MTPPGAGSRLPRLLAGVWTGRSLGLDEHLIIHGEIPLGPGGGRGASMLIDDVERAGLRGRGGAGFPVAVKLRAAAAGRRKPIVVANAAEGEPLSHKDRVLVAGAPHLVLDGGLAAAEAICAGELILCLPRSAGAAQQAIAQALEERRRSGGDRVSTRIEIVPDTYVSGQDSALVNHLDGGPAIPTLTPPFPTERGIGRRPTLVSNVETLAHLALVARHGPDWFGKVGTPRQPGSALVTLAGAVAHPGVYEIEPRACLQELLDAAGGALGPIRAFLVGGYSGTWLPAAAAPNLALCAEHLEPLGAALGAGVILALPGSACPVAEMARVMRWMAGQTAGQCGPCVNGLESIATAVEQLLHGHAPPGTAARLARWQALVVGRGACAHPDGAVRFLSSSLAEFAEEVAAHAANGPCGACAQPSVMSFPSARPQAEPATLR